MIGGLSSEHQPESFAKYFESRFLSIASPAETIECLDILRDWVSKRTTSIRGLGSGLSGFPKRTAKIMLDLGSRRSKKRLFFVVKREGLSRE